MMLRIGTAIVVVFAAATLCAQTSAGPLAGRRQAVTATSNAEGLAAANRAKAAANQNLEELGATLTKMQALLKQMRTHASNTKDPVAKGNLEMWTLMVEQLDKQYEQLRVAARQREDLEARRAAMYKQADVKAAEDARKGQQAANAAAPDSNASNAAAAQTTPTMPAAQTTATPAAPTTSPN